MTTTETPSNADDKPTAEKPATVTQRPVAMSAPAQEQAPSQPGPRNGRQRGPVSRFMRSLFSHLLFAGAAVAGVLGYLYHAPILRDVGDTVCAPQMLGQFMSKAPVAVATTKGDKAVTTIAQSSPAQPAAARSTPTTATSTAAKVPASVTPSTPVTASPAAMTAAPPATSPAPAVSSSVAATPASKPAQPSPSTAAAPAATAAAQTTASTTPASSAEASGPATSTASAAKPAAKAEATVKPATPAASAATSAATPSTPSAPTAGAAKPTQTAALPSDAKVATDGSGGGKAKDEKGAGRDDTSMMQQWAAARQAYADGKPEAVAAYKELVRQYPDVPDLTGELGNIYFQNGSMREAAEQYYETAQRLIRRGEPGPAACLVDVMRYLDSDKAKALQEQVKVPCPVLRK